MTATPRIYDDSTKTKAGEANAVLASMDDESSTGPSSTGSASVRPSSADLLTDYKVLVLTVDEESVARTFQQQLSDDDNELNLDDAAKIVGCWNGLAKRGQAEHAFEPDARADAPRVAFAGNIKDSKRIEELFQPGHRLLRRPADPRTTTASSPLECSVAARRRHDQRARAQHAARLAAGRTPAESSCRILTNARCLSEGVDVPALDAVMFLSPRKSVVDIVQSVGRVMRRRRGQGVRLHHPADRHPVRDDAEEALRGQQALRRRLAGPPGAARPRRALRRDDQPDRR